MATNPYLILVALHVMSVVLAAGPVLALAIASDGIPPPVAGRLALVASFGLLAVLLTGGAALAYFGAGMAQAWWLRISFVLLVVAGGLIGRLRGLTKKPEKAASIGPMAWAASGALALAVYLMEAKPF